MRVVIADTDEEFGRLAADAVEAGLRRGSSSVLGVATGSTPLPLYRELADRVDGGRLDLAGVRAFALDEYVGLAADHPQSYHSVIEREVTRPLRLDAARVRVPRGHPGPTIALARAAAAYEADIHRAGGVDVQILGIGSDGHLAFNEPGSSPESSTRVVRLAEQTRRDNARFFPRLEDVPRYAVTQGLGTILRARSLVVLARGAGKARAVARMLEGAVTTEVPASFVHRHDDVTVVLDRAAAGGASAARSARG